MYPRYQAREEVRRKPGWEDELAGSAHPLRHRSRLQLNRAWREEDSSRSREREKA